MLLFISLLLQSKVTAQFSINGTITDPSSVPINNAFVEIIDEDDTTNYYSTYTNESGSFIISNITDVYKSSNKLPNNFLVLSNYPNPFNPSTIIYYELPRAENIEIKIYDIIGREVRTILSKFQKAGIYNISWDGRSNFNKPVAAGVYLCRLKTKDQSKVHKMVLLDGGSNFSGAGNQILKKEGYSNIQSTVSEFNFSIRVTADSVLELEYNNLTCTSDTTLNLMVSKILKTVNIGTEGGMIETEDISISIPAGALNEGHDISIAKAEDDEAFGENAVSNPYQIIGLPNDFTKSIKVKLKYVGELTESSFVAVGTKTYNYLDDIYSTSYKLNIAADSGGYLISDLYSNSENVLLKQSTDTELNENELGIINFRGLAGYKLRQSDHFQIYYPFLLDSEIDKVEEILEEAIRIVLYDLKLSNYPPAIKRLVVIREQSNVVLPNPGYLLDEMLFNVNEATIWGNDFDKLKKKFGLAVIFFEQYGAVGEFNWLDIAIQHWSEELFSDPLDFKYPSKFPSFFMQPFDGLEIFADENIYNHGIGMSCVIKYLTEKSFFGTAGIDKLYKNTLYSNVNDGTDRTTIFLNSIDSPVEEWLPDFFKEYISGNIYNQSHKSIVSLWDDTWYIDSADDTIEVFSTSDPGKSKYLDLSAKKFKIALDYEPPDTSYKMLFNMSWPGANLDGLSMVIFGLKSGKIEYLGRADAQDFVIPNLKSYWADEMKEFLVVLVNSNITQYDYLGESDIDLTVKINQAPVYSMCSVTMNIPVETRTFNSGTNEEEFGTRLFPNMYPRAIGSFNGNTWTGYFDEDEWKGEIVVTLNDNFDMVLNMNFSYTILNEKSSGTFAYSFTDIPKSEYSWETGLYSLAYKDDPTLCNHVSNIVYNYTWGNITTNLNGTTVCDENSWLNVRFYP